MNAQQQKQPDNLIDLAVDLSACADGQAASAMLAGLHPATCGALLLSLQPATLAATLALLHPAECGTLLATLAPDTLATLGESLATLAPHVAPTAEPVAPATLASVSKITLAKAQAAAIKRVHVPTLAPELQKALTTPIGADDAELAAELSDYGIADAEKRAAEDPAFAGLLEMARQHGATCGASAHKKAAIKWAKDLADNLLLPTAVLLDLVEPDDTSADFPSADDAERVQLEYIGLANVGIKQAQQTAIANMPKGATAKQKSQAAKDARNLIGMRIKRQLEKYGVAVNLQTGDYSEIELEATPTDAEKACKAVVQAFDKSADGALDGLLALDGAAWAAMVAGVKVENYRREMLAREAQNASLSALAVANAIKAKATDDKNRQLARDDNASE